MSLFRVVGMNLSTLILCGRCAKLGGYSILNRVFGCSVTECAHCHRRLQD